MRAAVSLLCTLLASALAQAATFEAKDAGDHYDVSLDGKVWLRTMTPKYDAGNREDTYKVYTHVFDFDGKGPITKGPGGKYTHHRGLFIGWKDTIVNGVDFDTWHMVKEECTQRHVAWAPVKTTANSVMQVETVAWADGKDKKFIDETRAITTMPGENGARIFDFQSKLTSAAGTIQLTGDLQHAGMQVRMAQEVAEHETTTKYVLPAGAVINEDDKVTGAWWACCSCEVGGKRYWALHMTHPGTCKDVPVYSIRAYARFGAFWEPTLEEGKPQQYNFRIVFSETELDAAACHKLYEEYAKSAPAAL